MVDKCQLRLHIPNRRLLTFWIQYPIQSSILSLGPHHSLVILPATYPVSSCYTLTHPFSPALFLVALFSYTLRSLSFPLHSSSSIVHLRSGSVTHLNQVHIGHESLDLPDDLRLSGGIEFLKFNGENCLLLGLLFSRGFSR